MVVMDLHGHVQGRPSLAVVALLVLVTVVVGAMVVDGQQDGEPPTASIFAGPAFTAADMLLVEISLSKACDGLGGFQCNSTATCDLLVYGDGEVVPSSLQEPVGGLKFSLQVDLSTAKETGKVLLAMRQAFCTDAVGNVFQRSANSTAVVRFDRRPVTVNVWTPIPDAQVQINNEARTLEATNSTADLLIYADFSSPVLNSSTQIASALQFPHGSVTPTPRKSRGSRRFSFQLATNSNSSVITVSVPPNMLYGRSGLPVQPAFLSFLYDTVRPTVKLTTTTASKTRDQHVPVFIEFSEPVFGFNASGVSITGGTMKRQAQIEVLRPSFIDTSMLLVMWLSSDDTWLSCSFSEQSKRLYVMQLFVAADDVVSVTVGENKTSDVAGNVNLASSTLQVRHYTTPAISVALPSLISVGLLATALASGTLAVSSASLAAAGALAIQTAGSIGSDPSRNLMGMATHVQVLALSNWLAVSLPIEYGETVRGLRWTIPNLKLPWERRQHQPSGQSSLLGQTSPVGAQFDGTSPRLRMLEGGAMPRLCASSSATSHVFYKTEGDVRLQQTARSPKQYRRLLRRLPNMPSSNHSMPLFSGKTIMAHQLRQQRLLSVNASIYGPALSDSEYETYFLNGTSASELKLTGKYYGWQDFGGNMFWLGAGGGLLIFLHLLLLLLLRWRTKTSVRGALSVPRFEFFLLILALPCVCQASASLIRGGTAGGIVVGVLLLALPASFFLSVALFLIVAIFMGALVQYEELRQGQRQLTWADRILHHVAGENVISKWIRREGLAPTFLPRYGLLFEDRKGPPKIKTIENGAAPPRWVHSGVNGIGRMRAVDYSDDSEASSASRRETIFGAFQAAYILVDIARRILLGIVFGAYTRADPSWSQVSIVFSFTLLQLSYLVLFKPFIRRGVQLVETVSLVCELGIFAAAFALLARDHPSRDYLGIGIFMLLLLLTSFTFQLVNEWYALMNQLLRLAPTENTSLKLGLKMLAKGLLLAFLPRTRWSRYISPQILQAKPALPPLQHSPEAIGTGTINTPCPQPVQPVLEKPGSPVFADPRAIVSLEIEESGEITGAGSLQRPKRSDRIKRIASTGKRTKKSRRALKSRDLGKGWHAEVEPEESLSEASSVDKLGEEAWSGPEQVMGQASSKTPSFGSYGKSPALSEVPSRA